MIRFLISRIGCLMWLVGAIVLIVGIATESSGQNAFNLVLSGIGLTLVGFLLWKWLRPKGRRNTRFSMFRRRGQEDERDRYEDWDDRYDN
jgi:hypothetical protein